MNGLAQDSLLTLLKIGIIPVVLLSILWRNRRDRRRKAAERDQQQAEKARATRAVFDTGTAGAAALRMALDRLANGEALVTPRGTPITDAELRLCLADRLLAEGQAAAAQEAAQAVLSDEGTDPAMRAAALLRLARVGVLHQDREAARQALSQAADLYLPALRIAARGSPVHLADLLAEGLPEGPADLADPGLAGYGPLPCLWLSGRAGEARALAVEVLPALERALGETADDPAQKIDGLPRDVVQAAQVRLSRVAAGRA